MQKNVRSIVQLNEYLINLFFPNQIKAYLGTHSHKLTFCCKIPIFCASWMKFFMTWRPLRYSCLIQIPLLLSLLQIKAFLIIFVPGKLGKSTHRHSGTTSFFSLLLWLNKSLFQISLSTNYKILKAFRIITVCFFFFMCPYGEDTQFSSVTS